MEVERTEPIAVGGTGEPQGYRICLGKEGDKPRAGRGQSLPRRHGGIYPLHGVLALARGRRGSGDKPGRREIPVAIVLLSRTDWGVGCSLSFLVNDEKESGLIWFSQRRIKKDKERVFVLPA